MTQKEKIYSFLMNEVEKRKVRPRRYDMVSYCIGYYKQIDETIYECINKLYADNFIDA